MLSLKYRPFSFEEMVGLRIILDELKNRSNNLNFPQVSLYEGQSGTGKSTIARIVAALLNCKNPKTVQDKENTTFRMPCGECPSCLDIKQERFKRDVYVLDASSMSKDDVIGIRKLVVTSPLYDKNKIIIVDEAQELSKAGKGATLELLEKVRKNVYFFLCTMDITSFDIAVISRAQRYTFKPVKDTEIANYLFEILEKENLTDKVPEEFIMKGLLLLSKSSDGNVRNALQLLERCILGEFYTEEEMIKALGLIPHDSRLQLLLSLLQKKPEFFKLIKKYPIRDFYYYTWKLLTDAIVYKIGKVVDQEWKRKGLETLSKEKNLNDLVKVYDELFPSIKYIKRSDFIDNIYLSRIAVYYQSITNKVEENKLVRRIKNNG